MIYAVQQNTSEWLQLRTGRCTASRVKDVMDFTQKGLPTAKRTGYLYEIVCERMTGLAAEHFVSAPMQWGSETEDLARESYEVHTGNEVVKIGLATHPEIEMFAASPDGIVNGEWLFEAKCPLPGTHIKWILGQVVPEDHLWQCYAEMDCWGLDRVDFMSFDSRPRSRYQRFIRTLHRDDAKIAEMESGVQRFLGEVDAIMEQLDRLCPEDGEEFEQAPLPSALKEQLRKSVEVDPLAEGSGITDADIDWAKARTMPAQGLDQSELPEWARTKR